jgi:hypothetical protein
LLEGSPAIDKGNSFGATADQRGVARPQGAASDIGSFESESTVIEDTVKPRVRAATPTGTGIGRGTNVVATFSEKMSPASITKSTFTLFKVTSSGTTQVTNVTVTPSSDGLKATLNPFGTSSSLLAAGTKYKAVVTTGARDLAGNRLDQNTTLTGDQQKTWTFTTRGSEGQTAQEEGPGHAAPALLLAPIHRSAWKGTSRKFLRHSTIL